MIARILSFAFSGIEAVPVEVQVQISSGLPAFLVVGLPDKAVGEARERVRAALTAMGLSLPPKRVLINLAPADLLKEGSHYDLPIALAVLAAMDVLPREETAEYAALGELSLDGSITAVSGVLPAAMAASTRSLGLICPAVQGGEAAWAGRIEVLAAPDLLSLVNHFRGTQILTPPDPAGIQEAERFPDLAEVRGMETAKRALEIAAAGGHNLMLVGPPGAGKSMLAARLPPLLPDLAPKDALEVSMIHSVAGLLEGGRLVMRPPFREPHHGASQAALAGGGCKFSRLTAKYKRYLHRSSDDGRHGMDHRGWSGIAGNAVWAHRGVLHLDRLDEWSGSELSELEAPIETRRCAVGSASYPAAFLMVATARLPPSDGWPTRIPAPLFERFDVFASIPYVDQAKGLVDPKVEATDAVAARIRRVRLAQAVRARAGDGRAGSRDASVALDPEASIDADILRGHMPARALSRLIGVAGTIADLAGSDLVRRRDFDEARFFRPSVLVGVLVMVRA